MLCFLLLLLLLALRQGLQSEQFIAHSAAALPL
jgi:hypothetical protein